MATGTYPFLAGMPPERFSSMLSKSEIAIGAVLRTPFVPTVLAGAVLPLSPAG
jgi:hypothetical protein